MKLKKDTLLISKQNHDILITGSGFNKNLTYLILKTLRLFLNQTFMKPGAYYEWTTFRWGNYSKIREDFSTLLESCRKREHRR